MNKKIIAQPVLEAAAVFPAVVFDCPAGKLRPDRDDQSLSPYSRWYQPHLGQPGSMIITTWNVNGMRAVLGKGFLETMQDLGSDVACLQEVRARPEQIDPQHHQRLQAAYPHAAWNPAARPGYSGVATLSNTPPVETWLGMKTLFPAPLNPGQMGAKIYDLDALDHEGRVIVSRFPDFLLFNIYFPNGGRAQERLPYKFDFYGCLLDLCDDLHRLGEKVIICGDFNIAHRPVDLRNPKQNEHNTGFLPEERQWIDRYLEHDFVDIYRLRYPERVQYTWWTAIGGARSRNVGWRLDYFLVSASLQERVKDVIIHDERMGSDHCPVSLVL